MCFVQTVKFISPPGYGNYEDYGYNDGYGYGRDGYGHNMRAVGMMDRGMNLVLASVFFFVLHVVDKIWLYRAGANLSTHLKTKCWSNAASMENIDR